MDNTDYIYSENKKECNVSVKNIVGITLSAVLVIVLAVYGIFYNVKYHKQEIVMQNRTEQTFSNMIEYVNTAQDYMLKAMASNSGEQAALMLSEARRYTNLAQEDLTSLPVDESSVEDISDYLVKLSDIMGAWSKKAVNGDTLSADEYMALATLYGFSQDLSGALYEMNSELRQGKSNWKDITKDSKKITHNKILAEQKETLSRLAHPFTNMPDFEYDGKFSSHICKVEPRGLSGKEITKEKGEEIVRQIISKITPEYGKVKYEGNHMIQNIEVYSYSVTENNGENIMASLDITKQGGMLCELMMITKEDAARISEKEAVESGKKFLEEMNYQNMEEIYKIYQGNCMTITYAYTDKGVTYYPDLCKVKISLTSGEVTGFDGHEYLCCHEGRFLKSPSFTLEEGKEYISNKVKITESRQAVILTDYLTEEYVYEYKVAAQGREFLIHIDPQTGKEVQILLLIEDDGGLIAI